MLSKSTQSSSHPPLAGGWWKPLSTSSLPSLPPELWLKIMDQATFVPQALEAFVHDPFQRREIMTLRQIQAGLDAVSLTKRRLVLVCKTWKSLAVPILYSSIIVHTVTGLQKLISALHNNKLDDPNMTCGEWVRRLDLVFYDKFDGHMELETSPLAARLMAAFRRTPRLEMLAFRMPRDSYIHDVWESIFLDNLYNCLPSLRILHWPKIVYHRRTPEWLNMLARAPNLTACHGLQLTLTEQNLDEYAQVLPRLTYASACFDVAPAEATSQAVIQTPAQSSSAGSSLELHIGWGVWFNSEAILPVGPLSAIGPLLRRLSIDVPETSELDDLLEPLSECCPQLHQLVLHMDSWFSFVGISALMLPETLQYLGLGSKRIQYKQIYYRQIVTVIETLSAPKLMAIKFISDRNTVDLRKHPRALQDMVAICYSRKIELWDHAGLTMSR
jgi:hypothetical protein